MRYFFDTADGDKDIDHNGVALEGDAAAIREAIRYAGSMISDQPDLVTGSEEFAVGVRREEGKAFATVRIDLRLE